MPIRKYIIVILMTLSLSTIANQTSPPAWHWTTFELINETRFGDELLDYNNINNRLQNCLLNFKQDNINCNDAGVLLILLSKLDEHSTIIYANKFIQKIPNDWDNELFYVREDAIRALARIGKSSLLIENLNGEDPSVDEIYLMAQAKDYRWYEIILNGLTTTNDIWFCNTTLFVEPFLAEDFIHRQQFIDVLISTLSSNSSYKAGCSIYQLFNTLLDQKKVNVIKNTINILFNSNNVEWYETGSLLTDKWNINYKNNEKLISRIIELAVKKDNNNYVRKLMSFTLKRQDIIANLFTVNKSKQEDVHDLSFAQKTEIENFEEYLWKHKFDNIWLLYAKNLRFTDLQDLLLVEKEVLIHIKDTEKKLLYFKNNELVRNNRMLKSFLAELSITKNSPLAPQILNELYTTADALQKLALIGRYPQHFASKPVVRVKTNDPWIKLAEVTNLLTICKIEVPPVGSELSELAVLTKYLEDAETLFKDCSRLNNRNNRSGIVKK